MRAEDREVDVIRDKRVCNGDWMVVAVANGLGSSYE